MLTDAAQPYVCWCCGQTRPWGDGGDPEPECDACWLALDDGCAPGCGRRSSGWYDIGDGTWEMRVAYATGEVATLEADSWTWAVCTGPTAAPVHVASGTAWGGLEQSQREAALALLRAEGRGRIVPVLVDDLTLDLRAELLR